MAAMAENFTILNVETSDFEVASAHAKSAVDVCSGRNSVAWFMGSVPTASYQR